MGGTMSGEEITVFTLSNGLKCVHVLRRSDVEYSGVAVRVGSRDEAEGEEGIAHFVEHTIFKGTAKRPASSIINRMEMVGGELNAYTTKEETYVYSIYPGGNTARAIELIADLVINSVFPQRQLDREREVVAEEIDSYLDNPSESVFDDFEDLLFKGSGLGHNILGNTTSLASFDSRRCRSFIERFYRRSNMVFFYLGPMSPKSIERLATRYFEAISHGDVTHDYQGATAGTPFRLRRDADENHQAHTVMGCELPSLYDPARYPLMLLNNILGGPGMNSRLNVQLRERRGLVYNVESSISLFSDTGMLTIYFGCNPEDRDRCVRLVESELRRISEEAMGERALERARRQFLGQQVLASASAEQVVLSAARSLLLRGEIMPREAVNAKFKALTPDDIAEASRWLAPERFSILTLG